MTGIKIIVGIATKDSTFYTHLLLSEWTNLVKRRKRIWWMILSTGSFISATNFGTATKVCAIHSFATSRVKHSSQRWKKRICWLCSSTEGFISATSIRTLEMKLHTFVKKIFKVLWLEQQLFWELQQLQCFQLCYTEWRHLRHTACRQCTKKLYVDQKRNHMHMLYVIDMCPAKNICATLYIFNLFF